MSLCTVLSQYLVLPCPYGDSVCICSLHIPDVGVQESCKLSPLYNAALSKCFVAVGSIEGVAGSKHQVPLPARGLLVKSNVE